MVVGGPAGVVVAIGASEVVVGGVVVVVEVGRGEDDVLGTSVVVELATVASGGAAEHEATRRAADNAVRRAKDEIRTGMDRISARRPRRFSTNRKDGDDNPQLPKGKACSSPAQFPFDRRKELSRTTGH